VAALHRAVAFVEVEDVAVAVAEDLHLEVFGAGDVFLEEDRGIAEGAAGFGLGFVEQLGEVGSFEHDAHAASTAAEGRLDDEREADRLGGLERLVAIGDRLLRAGQGRHADPLGEGAGGGLVAHHVEQLGAGPDEGDARGRRPGRSRRFR
jgi:hypothetical protein